MDKTEEKSGKNGKDKTGETLKKKKWAEETALKQILGLQNKTLFKDFSNKRSLKEILKDNPLLHPLAADCFPNRNAVRNILDGKHVSYERFGRTPSARDVDEDVVYQFENSVFDPKEYSDRMEILLTEFLHKTLAGFYRDRYQSMEEAKAALEEMLPFATPDAVFLHSTGISEPVSMIGREKELQEIHRWWRDSSQQVLYVTGMGGIGKSTLIRKAIAETFTDQEEQPDHLLFLSVAGRIQSIVSDDTLVALHGITRLKEESEADYFERKVSVLGCVLLHQKNAEQAKQVLRMAKRLAGHDPYAKALYYDQLGQYYDEILDGQYDPAYKNPALAKLIEAQEKEIHWMKKAKAYAEQIYLCDLDLIDYYYIPHANMKVECRREIDRSAALLLQAQELCDLHADMPVYQRKKEEVQGYLDQLTAIRAAVSD